MRRAESAVKQEGQKSELSTTERGSTTPRSLRKEYADRQKRPAPICATQQIIWLAAFWLLLQNQEIRHVVVSGAYTLMLAAT